MGNGIAHVFAQKNHTVHLIDISQEAIDKGMNTIAKNLDRMVKKEKISAGDKIDTINNIQTFTDLQKGVAGCELIVEAATENL